MFEKSVARNYREGKIDRLKNIHLGNLGVFVSTKEDQQYLIDNVDKEAY